MPNTNQYLAFAKVSGTLRGIGKRTLQREPPRTARLIVTLKKKDTRQCPREGHLERGTLGERDTWREGHLERGTESQERHFKRDTKRDTPRETLTAHVIM